MIPSPDHFADFHDDKAKTSRLYLNFISKRDPVFFQGLVSVTYFLGVNQLI